MSYPILALLVVAVAAVISVPLLWVGARTGLRRTLAAMGIAALAVGILTAVFDSIMIAAGLFQYVEDRLLGVHIGLAPIEDFSYVIAAALLLPALWVALGRRAEGRSRQGGRDALRRSGGEAR